MNQRNGQLDYHIQVKEKPKLDIQKMIENIDQREIGIKKERMIELDYEFSFDSKQKERREEQD